MFILWFQFISLLLIILCAGFYLSVYADIIAEKSGMDKLWAGIILVGFATSLPELLTGISSVTFFKYPNIGVGTVLGGCIFNIFILGIIDLFDRKVPLSAQVHEGHNLSAAFGTLMLALILLSVILGPYLPSWRGISLMTPIFLGVYVLVMKILFVHEQKRVHEFAEKQEAKDYAGITLKKAIGMYLLFSFFVILSASYLPIIGEEIASSTGLGQTFVGTTFLAIVTSLPKILISLTAMKIGAIDMAFGNLLSGNLFSGVILAFEDIFFKPALFDYTSNIHALTGVGGILMTTLAIIGLTFRSEKKIFVLAWDAAAIVTIYVATIGMIYAFR